jgi:hypothetical protein
MNAMRAGVNVGMTRKHEEQLAVSVMKRALLRKSRSVVVPRRKNVALHGRLKMKTVLDRKNRHAWMKKRVLQKKSGELVGASVRWKRSQSGIWTGL